jgi:hypothetical protein
MRQLILIVILAILVLLGAGVLLLGAFPPHLTPQPVQRTLPNDSFKAR